MLSLREIGEPMRRIVASVGFVFVVLTSNIRGLLKTISKLLALLITLFLLLPPIPFNLISHFIYFPLILRTIIIPHSSAFISVLVNAAS